MARKKKQSGKKSNSKNIRISNADLQILVDGAHGKVAIYNKMLKADLVALKKGEQTRFHNYFFGANVYVDAIVTKELEQKYGLVFVLAKLSEDRINVCTLGGRITDNNTISQSGNSVTLQLDEYRHNTTTSRFASSLCGILTNRYFNGSSSMRGLFPGNPSAEANRILINVEPHTSKAKSNYKG